MYIGGAAEFMYFSKVNTDHVSWIFHDNSLFQYPVLEKNLFQISRVCPYLLFWLLLLETANNLDYALCLSTKMLLINKNVFPMLQTQCKPGGFTSPDHLASIHSSLNWFLKFMVIGHLRRLVIWPMDTCHLSHLMRSSEVIVFADMWHSIFLKSFCCVEISKHNCSITRETLWRLCWHLVTISTTKN